MVRWHVFYLSQFLIRFCKGKDGRGKDRPENSTWIPTLTNFCSVCCFATSSDEQQDKWSSVCSRSLLPTSSPGWFHLLTRLLPWSPAGPALSPNAPTAFPQNKHWLLLVKNGSYVNWSVQTLGQVNTPPPEEMLQMLLLGRTLIDSSFVCSYWLL